MISSDAPSTNSMRIYVPLTVKIVDPNSSLDEAPDVAPVSLTFDLRSLLTSARSSAKDGNGGTGISRSVNVSLTILIPDETVEVAA